MRATIGAVSLALVAATSAGAQALQPELRLDVLGPPPVSPQLGIGVTAAPGLYTRVTAAAGYGPARSDGARGAEWRGDLIVRVTLDPFRQQRFALAFGGGLTVRRVAYLAVVADLEGPARAGWVPVLQLGMSGGVRAGLMLRRAIANRR